MKKHSLLTKSIFILSLMLFWLSALPSSSLAFRNPNEAYQPPDPSTVLQSRPTVPLAPAARAEAEDDDGEDASAGEIALPLRSGEVSLMDERASLFRIASGFEAFNLQHQNQWKANFSEKTGRGRAYLNNDKWWDGIINNVLLKHLFTERDGYEEGWLWGSHADVYDYAGNDPFAPNFQFFYYPDLYPHFYSWHKPRFDAAHAYFQKNTVWEWWDKQVIRKYGPKDPDYFYTLSVPVVVSLTDVPPNPPFCNAFYTSDLGGGEPGFGYGNENECSPGSEDLVIDNDVVRHEYAHAIMHWAGFEPQFGGDVDHYGRAMGEGNSDWYAFLYSKKPEMGDVAFPPFLRNLDNTRMYPYNVNLPADGMPQEHYTGQIWGSYLYDLSRVLKNKALQYVYSSSFYFSPIGGHRDGLPDFVDAIFAQSVAEYEKYRSQKQTERAYGSMVSRGLIRPLSPMYSHATNYFWTGAAGSDARAYISWDFPPRRTLKTEGNLLTSGDPHEYAINANAGMNLTATVTGKTGGLVSPVIELYTIGGVLLASAPPGATQATLTFVLPSTGGYVIRVTGAATAPA